MPDDAARFYTANVILGMEYLHEQSIAFRDLKPENLLVTSTGYLKFVDFGFAKQIPFLDVRLLPLQCCAVRCDTSGVLTWRCDCNARRTAC